MSGILDGKKISESIQSEIAQEVAQLKRTNGVVPGLAVLLVGEDPASKIYVRNKETACQRAGMFAEQHNLPATVSEGDLLRLIDTLNRSPKIHSILVQLPLPKTISESRILEAISPKKDVDGFHPLNLGNLFSGRPTVVPCTPLGILTLLERTGVPIEGKDAIIIGRSTIVGKPTAILLMQRHATVTIAHTRTQDLAQKIGRADIVVAAVGRPELVKGPWIKEGAVVIDVGINRQPNGKLVGDVEFEEARKRASFITPVPGGVGPMTIAMLLANTLAAAKRSVDLP